MQIHDSMRRCVVFLYAKGGAAMRPVGTGFIVSMYLTEERDHTRGTYLITAKHVLEGVHHSGMKLFARVNGRGTLEMALWGQALKELERLEKKGEETNIIVLFEALKANPPEVVLRIAEEMAKYDPAVIEGAQFIDLGEVDKWTFHKDPNVDAAMLAWHPPATVDVWPYPLRDVVTPELIAKEGIGLGEDVFVVGLFSRRIGKARNIPIIRVGNIVAMPEEPIETGTGLQDAYLIELLSIGGLSGSPVFTYLSGVRYKHPMGGEIELFTYAGAVHLLGIVHGHWNLASEEQIDTVRDTQDSGERVNMGIAIVVPIARVLEILEYPEVKAAREK